MLLPVPAKPVNKTGVFELIHSMIVPNAACCLVVSFILESLKQKAIFFNAR